MTLFNWGESPRGKWRLIIQSRRKNENTINNGRLEYFSLKFYGIKNGSAAVENTENRKEQLEDDNDEARLKKRFSSSKAFMASHDEVAKIYKRELNLYQQTKIVHKRVLDKRLAVPSS
jgi:subtilisin-like proprotein convertase family protein